MDRDVVTLVKRKRFDEALAALAAGADPEPKKPRGESALLWAVVHRRVDVVRALILTGVNPSPRTTGKRAAGIGVGGATPLHIAASIGDVELIEVLVRGRAVVDAQDASGAGYTALHMAAQEGRAELATFLLQRGASANPIQDDKWPPLRHALLNGHTAVADLLRRAGAV